MESMDIKENMNKFCYLKFKYWHDVINKIQANTRLEENIYKWYDRFGSEPYKKIPKNKGDKEKNIKQKLWISYSQSKKLEW